MTEKEPDLTLDHPLGGMKKITPVQGMKSVAPEISWGSEYCAWPVEKRLRYAERLASTMNHAADVLQQQSNEQAKRIKDQDERLKDAARKYLAQGELMHRELCKENEEKQRLYTEIVSLGNKVRDLTQKLKANGYHD